MNHLFDNISNDEEIIGLNSETKSIYIYEKFSREKVTIVCVFATLYEASKYFQSISNYTSDVLLFPMDDFVTSEILASSPELKITRIETLLQMSKGPKIVVTDLMGYLRYLPLKEEYDKATISLKINDIYSINKLVNKLDNIGYKREIVVNKTGEMAIRGFVVDIFPVGEKQAIRIEYWGDQIESIRSFDVNTQRTIEDKGIIDIKPNTEFICASKVDNSKQSDLIKYTKVTNISNYVSNTITVFNNYNQLLVSYNLLFEQMMNYITDDNRPMYELNKIYNKREIYFSLFDDAITKNYKKYNILSVEPFTGSTDDTTKRLDKYIKDGKKVIICLDDKVYINKIIELLGSKMIVTNENNLIDKKINVVIKKILSGYIMGDCIVISSNELFNRKETSAIYKTNFKFGTKIRDISKLVIGDYVVHYVHGIGIYRGIKTLIKNGLKKDYINVEYKGKDRLYIPVEDIDHLSKYSSKEGTMPKVNKLGSIEWEKTKQRIQKKIHDMAQELVELYAKRQMVNGIAFNRDDENQAQFESEFIYEETEDQLKVSEEIKRDMELSVPMDRLLCGDVGYGKTEVAFRAAFKAIISGKQVALLCPTTILSNQHYQNAIERFKSFPVEIRLLNRFTRQSEENKTLEELELGKVDFVIGTHKILNEKIKYKHLGLLIVDEEQRFGVKHKEEIKKYKNNIDVLTLSATPIPRTLQMSMSGIRSLSLLETPPNNRYPIQTYVLSYNKQILKDAIYKELARDGQTYILYNFVEGMEFKAKEISNLVPEAKVVFAHGRMSKNELEDIMFRFTNKEYDVLLCTTIIETGIDIPTVNTLIVIDADCFGLSQLYQLRGRVGRSNKIAYCYLTYNGSKQLTETAIKRLSAIKEFTELGSGYSIALRDLSIRGAGDILGSEQAGFVDAIGLELFMQMLQDEITELKGEENDSKDSLEVPLLEVETSIDDAYVCDEEIKIEMHKKINSIDSYKKLEEVRQEFEDRFGKLSETMIIYMYSEWVEKEALKLGIRQIKQSNKQIEIILDENVTCRLNGEKLFKKLSLLSNNLSYMSRKKRLMITVHLNNEGKHFVYELIEILKCIKSSVN